jgi:hypothetical protein
LIQSHAGARFPSAFRQPVDLKQHHGRGVGQRLKDRISCAGIGMTSMRPFAWLCAAFLLAGCAELLPKSRAETHAEWPSFEAVRAAIEQIEPYKTTKADLIARGIGAPGDPTITLLSHVDIAIRFPIGGVLSEEDVDPGIRDCMKAGKACSGYLVNMRRIKRDRIGNFWADAFAFRRETDVTGWTFNALIIFVDEVAVYAVYGGQPTLHETEVDRNPLGPLQGWGDWATSRILR